VAVFKAGMYEYDAGFAYIHLKEAQPFFNMQDGVNGIEVKVDDIDRADVIAWHIQETLGYPYAAQDWKQMNKNLFAALKLEKLVMFVILVLIVIVASFNIISNLIMVVSEKSREIAILKAMGATDRGVMTIFMIYGLTIGVIGTAIGLTGGYVTCYLLDTYKFIHLQSDVYFLSYLPVKTAISDFLYVSLSAITISFSATIYPALKASRMNPVEPLRYE
ncbi:MAG TPA: FtsX-like permease family protein, partial [Thermodesulfovibrionia bacterium]|nr:FtsX-like permease family protein [Thermodesulfovibrionia bacterium]